MVDRRRLYRAQNQDISIQYEISSHQYMVNGARGITYRVNLQTPSCTCPDWKKREPTDGCKHILAAKIHRNDIEKSGAVSGENNRDHSPDKKKWADDKTTASTENNSESADGNNMISTTESSLRAQSTSSGQNSNVSLSDESSSQPYESIKVGLTGLFIGGFLELSRANIIGGLTPRGEAILNYISFGGVNVLIFAGAVYTLIGLFYWVDSHN